MEAPKTIEVPGIPGPLREQTLDEYMSALPADHYARKELAEIRANALKAVDYANQLIDANEKVMRFQKELITWQNSAANNAPQVEPGMVVAMEPGSKPAPAPDPWPKVKCPNCDKMVSSAPGPWASHQKGKHNLTGVPVPELYKTS